jgi:tetratricopeptide (TPR) repeat protein
MQEARHQLEWAIDRMGRALGPDHEITLSGVSLWGELLVDVECDRQRVAGTASGASLRGELLVDRGRLTEARDLLVDTVRRLERVRGPSDYETLVARHRLALAYRAGGDWEEFRSLRADLLATLLRVPSSAHWLRVVSQMTRDLEARGQRDEAIAMCEVMYNKSRDLRGLRHPETLRWLEVVAMKQLVAGHLERARELLQDVVDWHIATGNPSVSHWVTQLVLLHRRMGNKRRARELLERVLEWRIRSLGAKHRDTLHDMYNLASFILNLPEAERRSEDVARAVELAEALCAASPKNHMFVTMLGIARYRSGDFEAAIGPLEWSARGGPGSRFGPDGFFLAMAYAQIGHDKTAREYFDRAVAWMQQHERDNGELIRFRAEAEAVLRSFALDAVFPADPFARAEGKDREPKARIGY